MSTSLMYHGFGLTEQEYLKTGYKWGQIIFYVETRREIYVVANVGVFM